MASRIYPNNKFLTDFKMSAELFNSHLEKYYTTLFNI